MKRVATIILSLIFVTMPAWSVPPRHVSYQASKTGKLVPKDLSLADAVLLTVRNNPQMRSAALQRVIDKFSLEVAHNEFEPQYSLTGSVSYAQGQGDPFYQLNPGVSLKTPFGTQIDINGENRIFGDERQRASISIKQPLLRGFGPSVTLAGLNNAKDGELINRLAFKNQAISSITTIIQAYHQLVQSYQSLTVDQLALDDSLNTLETTRLRIKAGKAAETEVTQQEAQVANQRFAVTRDKNSIDRDYQNLLTLLGLNPRAKLNIDQKITLEGLFLPDQAKCIKLALSNNVSYQQSLISFRQSERRLMVEHNNQLPDLNVTVAASKNLRDRDDAVFGDEERRISLNLSVPIDDRSRQAGLVNAKIELEKLKISLADQKRKLETDVINAIRDLHAQQEQIKLAENSVKYSKESLEIAQKKFEYGRTTMFEITSLRRNLTQSELTLINQKIAYLNTFAQFEQTLGISLDRWKLKLKC